MKRRLSSAQELDTIMSLPSQSSGMITDEPFQLTTTRGIKRFRTTSKGGVRKRGRGLSNRQLAQVKNAIHREQELKYYFTNTGTTGAPFAITVAAILSGVSFDVPQSAGASTDNSRIGDRIKWCGTLEWNYEIQSIALCDLRSMCRIVVLQWHGLSTGTPFPTPADIFLAGPSAAVDVWSVYNHDKRHMYKILYDKQHLVYLPIPAVNGNNMVSTGLIKARIPLTRAQKDCQFVAGGGQGSNRLFYLVMSSPPGAAAVPVMIGQTKVFFRDA